MSHFIEKIALGQVNSGAGVALPKASISMSPSNPAPTTGDAIVYYLTINRSVNAGALTIAQTGDLVDGDFDTSFLAAVQAAADATEGVTFDGTTLHFDVNFPGAMSWVRTIVGVQPQNSVHTVTLSIPVGLEIGIGSASIVVTEDLPLPDPVPGNIAWGVNLAGGEFGGLELSLATRAYSYSGPSKVQRYYDLGYRVFRYPVRWPRMVVGKFGPINEPELSTLDAVMAKIGTLSGAKLILDFHDYGEFEELIDGVKTVHKINEAGYAGALADAWIKVAGRYASYGSKLEIGLMNEPKHNWTAVEWRDAALYEINLMRQGGLTQKIWIPGKSYTGAHSWANTPNPIGTTPWDVIEVDGAGNSTGIYASPSGNAEAWDYANLTVGQRSILAAGPFGFELHAYFDIDASGRYKTATAGAGAGRLINVTNWLRTQSVLWGFPVKGFIGESGFAANEGMYNEIRGEISYMEANSDVWDTIAIWAGGEWNASYFQSIEPLGSTGRNPIDRPQMKVALEKVLPQVNPAAPTGISLTNNAISPSVVANHYIGDLRLLGIDPEDFMVFEDTFTFVDDAGGRFSIIGKELRVGVNATFSQGTSYQPIIRGKNRAGATIEVPFVIPVLASPGVTIGRTTALSVNEGANIVIRVGVTNPIPNTGFDLWVGGAVPAQMVGTWESVARPAFEAKGCTVRLVNNTKVEVRFGPTTPTGNIDITWQTKADSQTETGQFQWDAFLDNLVGVNRTSGSHTFGYINDTSTSPPWSITMNPPTVYEGETLTYTLSMPVPTIGQKIRLTPSGTAVDADFNVSFDAAIAAALDAGLTYNPATREIEVVGAWDGSLSWSRVIVDDADIETETHTVTLSSPVNSSIGVGAASTTIRALSAVQVVSQDYESAETNLTTVTRSGVAPYQTESGALSLFQPDTLRVGSRGLLLGHEGSNIINNPRGLGGTVGTSTLPTGWSIAANGITPTFVGRGEEDGHSYVDIRLTGTSGSGSAFTCTLNMGGPTDAIALPGEYTFSVGVKIVAGNQRGFSSATGLVAKPYTSTGATAGTSITGSGAYGTVRQFFSASGTILSPATRLRPSMTFNRLDSGGLSTVDMTIRIYSPTISYGASNALPLPIPANTYGPVAFGADSLTFNHTPASEGVVQIEWTPVTRKSGEVLCCLYSDQDNWIQLEYGDYGYLRLRSSVNGVIGVDLQGSYVVKDARHRAAFRYSYGDWALALDGEIIGTSSITSIPPVNTIAFGQNATGNIRSTMYLHKWSARNDQRTNANLVADTVDDYSGMPMNVGINLAGAEFGIWNAVKDGDRFYRWPTTTQFDRWNARGVKRFRIPYLVENLVRTADGLTYPSGAAWNAAEKAKMITMMDQLAVNGQKALLDRHNYGEYTATLYGKGDANNVELELGTGISLQDYKDFYEELASTFVGHPALWGYDIENEPRGTIPTQTKLEFYQAAIDTIREIDMDCWIICQGNQAGNAEGWPSKSSRWIELVDPANKLIPGAHMYMDKNTSGTYTASYPDGSNPETGVDRLTPYSNWLRAHGYEYGHCGELGWPRASGWQRLGFNAFRFARKRGIFIDGWMGGYAGENEQQRLEPINGVIQQQSIEMLRSLVPG